MSYARIDTMLQRIEAFEPRLWIELLDAAGQHIAPPQRWLGFGKPHAFVVERTCKLGNFQVVTESDPNTGNRRLIWGRPDYDDDEPEAFTEVIVTVTITD